MHRISGTLVICMIYLFPNVCLKRVVALFTPQERNVHHGDPKSDAEEGELRGGDVAERRRASPPQKGSRGDRYTYVCLSYVHSPPLPAVVCRTSVVPGD